jgi:hypothetical protein
MGASVNKNSPRETVHEASICLQKFASQIIHTDGEIYPGLTREVSCTLGNISDVMVDVRTLLKDKSGPKDPEIKGEIEVCPRQEYFCKGKFERPWA